MPQYELNNSAHWELLLSELYQWQPSPTGGFFPIEPFFLPVVITTPFVGILTANENAPPHWTLGARVTQALLGSPVPGERLMGERQFARLNYLSLLQFEQIAPEYGLYIEVPKWHKKLQVDIYQYNGPIIANSEDLKGQLDRIEMKVS